MRTFGLGLALVATAQITLLSSPALADDAKYASAESEPPPPKTNQGKATAGWVLLGAGGAVAIGGIVIDAVAGTKNQVSGSGAGDDGKTQGAKTDLLFAGTTMILAGVLVGIYGGSLIASSRKADVDAQTAAPPANGSSDPVIKAAQASIGGAPAFVLPVVGARF
jgi:hypothetical protein